MYPVTRALGCLCIGLAVLVLVGVLFACALIMKH